MNPVSQAYWWNLSAIRPFGSISTRDLSMWDKLMNKHRFKVEKLQVRIFHNRQKAGTAAAIDAAEVLRTALKKEGPVRIIVGSAPSQNELLAGLAQAKGIDWKRVTIFHLDEYVGLPATHPASFRNYQEQTLLARVTPAAFHGIRGESSDAEAECARYSALLGEAPIDLVCMGIGENGHIAFNDPPVADFSDPAKVKIVELDEACRRQQVNDGCFPDFDSVPRHALTLTCPMIMSGRRLVCIVPGVRKASAVAATLRGPMATSCPASILRAHPSATLFLDNESASKIEA
jgi:glucosamine-6-phosphate deaminase